ncbi:hypothetical protein RHSIM_RhsimUnG0002000 [Rhododendron simsii]|uniref:Uncharacterized protein n=1 Tax=Rhododendron simsii TaxID=118357 RepID=A0A834L646_RHOSS|nr:hypothetical protein RHSIM_RhsimUnG0002000 [Rhododendron simsii]
MRRYTSEIFTDASSGMRKSGTADQSTSPSEANLKVEQGGGNLWRTSRDDEACKFFDWVDLSTCERGKDFGNRIVKKNDDLQKENVDFRAKIAELKEREEWFLMKMNCMNRNLKEMEDDFALKMEQ